MILVAVRRYDLDDVPAVDRLYRHGSSYALQQTGGGEPERVEILSPVAARDWLDSTGPDDDTLMMMGR
jgi:hypothetical protein